MTLSADQRARIQATFTRYLATRAKNAEKLSLADLKFNVVHLRTNSKMLDLLTPLELIRYRLAQNGARQRLWVPSCKP